MEDAAAATRVLDPEIALFVRELNEGYAAVADFERMPRAARREAAERIRARWASGGPAMAETIETRIAGRRARLHRPERSPRLPVMLYLHGGGWTMFSIDTHDRLMREYAARAGIAVLGLDYSLSPEARYPAALDETVAAARWIREQGVELGVDPRAVAVGGDSAGANLAVAAALRLRDSGATVPQALLLNYGAFGPDHLPSYERFGGPEYMLTPAEMDGFWSDYVADAAELEDPLVAPVRASLRGLPPSFLAIAECDILADVNRAMARRLREAGVEVEERVYGGASHSFLEAVSVAALAQRAIDEASAWLRARLRRT